MRLPAKIQGISAIHQQLATQVIREMGPSFQGMISTGDLTDVCTVDELSYFLDTIKKLQTKNPLARTLMFITGNHEVMHAGTTNSGKNFASLLGRILQINTGQTYKKDVHAPESGGQENVLDKEILLSTLYQFAFKHGLNPTLMLESNRKSYQLADGSSRKWDNLDAVYNNFWKLEKDGSYNSLVQNSATTKDLSPEEKWVHTSAVKMEDLQTANGNHPVYMIGLDTMDYTGANSARLGGVYGHVSFGQVQRIKAFIDHIKKQNPGLSPKFILGGHHNIQDLSHYAESGLSDLLSDDSVIAYVGAHAHIRGYTDLASETNAKQYKISRENPLPQITVPSVMDYPNEMMTLDYGVKDPKTNELYFRFEFKGIDEKNIPGRTALVDRELAKIKPSLNSFQTALAHFDDDQTKLLGNPKTNLWDKLETVLDLDHGLITRKGHVKDTLIAHDVIPTMVQGDILYKKLAIIQVKLQLIESGRQTLATSIEQAYSAYLNKLIAYYEEIYGEGNHDNHQDDQDENQAPDTSLSHKKHTDIHELESYAALLDTALSQAQLSDSKLASTKHLLSLMRGDINFFKDWLIQYDLLQRTKRGDEQLIMMANLYGNEYFGAMREHLMEIPYNSQAGAFITLAGLESARQEYLFKNAGTLNAESMGGGLAVPKVIEFTVSTVNGQVKLHTAANPIPESAALEGLLTKRPDAYPVTLNNDDDTNSHATLSLGVTRSEGVNTPIDPASPQTSGPFNSVKFSYGRAWHLLGGATKPRLNFGAEGELLLDWQKRYNPGQSSQWLVNGALLARGTIGVGDPWGFLNAGIAVEAGPGLRQYDDDLTDRALGTFKPAGVLGVGGFLSLADGAGTIEMGRQWYLNNEETSIKQFYFGASVDVLAILRLMGKRDRDR